MTSVVVAVVVMEGVKEEEERVPWRGGRRRRPMCIQ